VEKKPEPAKDEPAGTKPENKDASPGPVWSGSAQAAQFMTQSVFAPLNDRSKLVAPDPQYGEFKVNGCMFDGGAISALLPWPSDPDDALWDAMTDVGKYRTTIQVGVGVGGEHPLLELFARDENDYFDVRVQGILLGRVSVLRFVITTEAMVWLKQRGRDDSVKTTPADKNLPFALIGQMVLKTLYTMQFGKEGMLLFRPHLFGDFLKIPDVLQMVDFLSIAKRAQDDYQKVKDLYEDLHGVEDMFVDDESLVRVI